MNKKKLIAALRKFNDREVMPNPEDYSDRRSYTVDFMSVVRNGRHALNMLFGIEHRSDITTKDIMTSIGSVCSGRLEVRQTNSDVYVDYTAGQSFATEYRHALCSALAHALTQRFIKLSEASNHPDRVYRTARLNFGAELADAWFKSTQE